MADIEERFKELENLIKSCAGNKIRYRIQDNNDFTNDFLVGCEIRENTIIMKMQNNSIKTSNVKDISFTEQEDRTDFWLYGDKVNRFNLFR